MNEGRDDGLGRGDFDAVRRVSILSKACLRLVGVARWPGLELAGEVADGVFLIFPTERSIGSALDSVRDGAKRSQRDPEKIDVIAYVFACVAANRDAAVESSRRTIAYFSRLHDSPLEGAGFEPSGPQQICFRFSRQ
jgi:alkanesulfonate monooxygenase SsuD/methylene tetrahydromethanopterin reductase-like flavin-dependent oxidoreductase (luciferase family)